MRIRLESRAPPCRTYSGDTSGAVFFNNGTGALTLTGGISIDMPADRIAAFAAQDADLNPLGEISSSSDIVMDFRGGGTGRTIALGGVNSYSGATLIGRAGLGATGAVTIRASVLADTGVNSSFGTGTAGGITLLNGSVVSYTGSGSSSNRDWIIGGDDAPGGSILNDGSGALTLSGAVDFDVVADNNLTLGGGYSGTNSLSGVISGNGALRSSGSGTWVLTGANTRIGTITVDGGTLRAGNASAFGTTTGVTVNDGTLDLGDFDLATSTLAGAGGTIALGTGTLMVDTGIDTSYAGVIAGSGSLVKEGAGTLTLTGANAYTGDTVVSGGGLALDFSAPGAPAANIIASASTRNMAGGQLDLTGAGGAANSQSFDGLNVTAGSSRIAATSGAGGSLSVDFGMITRTGGLVDFTLPTSGNFTTSSTSLGGRATVNGSDYAKVVGGVITAFEAADYSAKDDAGNWLSGEVISDAGGAADTPFFGTVSGSQQLAGLKYSAAADSTVSIGAGQTLGVDGTIIIASSVGSANQTISGGSLTGGSGSGALGILQNGTGNFTTASTIIDNGGATGFTKGGTGLVTLTAANSYTGATTLSGTLEIDSIANGGAASNIGASTADASNLVLESGTLRYTGASGSTDRGFTLVNGGASRMIDIAAGGTNLTFDGLVTSADNAGLTKAGAGTLTLANGGNGELSGTGALTKDGAGTLVFTADNSGYLGSSRVKGGTLAVDGILGGKVGIAVGGRLEGNGQVGGVANAGVVAPGRSIGTLTIAGDYAGDDGLLEIEATLGADDSPTDLLVVEGDTSGSTAVNVINRNGLGAQTQNGIKIIDVGGDSNGSFTLDGDYLFEGEQAVVAGAYGYRLYKNGIADPADGDWYLRSTLLDSPQPGETEPLLYQPGVPIYESYASTLQQFNKLDTLQERVGNRLWAAGAQEDTRDGRVIDSKGIWARIEAAHAEFEPDLSTSNANYDLDTWRLQAGIDGLLMENDAGHLIGGMFAQYGTVSSSIWSPYGVGSVDTTGNGLGATLTWYGENGIYVDGQAQVTWYDSDLSSATAGRNLVTDNNGVGYGLGIEAGQRIELDENWSVTPQAQLAYSSVWFDVTSLSVFVRCPRSCFSRGRVSAF